MIPDQGWLLQICGNRRQCARCNREKILLRQSSLRSRFGGVGGYGGTSVVVQAPTAWPTVHHKPLMMDQIHHAS